MNKEDCVFEQMDILTERREPFFFLIDFECNNPAIYKLDQLGANNISIHFPQFPYEGIVPQDNIILITKHPISFQSYRFQFDETIGMMQETNVPLLNLTCETPININSSLKELFIGTSAKYKILYQNKFICFSPETFIKINDNTITSFPMKGTISAELPNAKQIIINDPKEIDEHKAAVTLVIDDLGKVANNIYIKQYRYIDYIKTKGKNLLQVSSEVEGEIIASLQNKYGSLIKQLLPAASISGSPKGKAVSILNKVETHKRNYYTGIAGVFDGISLDSCVLIRYIENRDNSFYYKSGGGITLQSKDESEYKEMIDKVYVPVD